MARLRMPAGPPALVTTGEWLDRWLAERTGPRASTIRGYAAYVRLYLRPCLGRILLADLTAQHVQAMFTAITRQHEAEGHPVTAATLARVWATLCAALNAAIRAGLVGVNAASRADLPGAVTLGNRYRIGLINWSRPSGPNWTSRPGPKIRPPSKQGASTPGKPGQTGRIKMTWSDETPGHHGCAARDFNPEPAD